MSTRIQQLRAIYDSLPKLVCKGLCSSVCGPVMLSALEAKRVYKAGGVHLGQKFMRADSSQEQKCPALKEHLCSVYEQRPMICRLWGATERLKCPHGCEPERWLKDDEARALLKEVMDLGGTQK